ncbi:MAG: hypothetical protein AVDCRST_MAG12-1063 [uncultured Rubrobacteraceae bacterium]|uniref:3-oxoacyl-[acyl-carrier protein] reductase n=1 Tax=uncultured Rubrobacteraceae bacterium TaxID=349277 RepID=A0A6J4RIV3_9ACTN|nr:MAG: hypothetical protein AVDCRST_MAG12-1063 [uncultured Rubrobacteraceae bacterium]
MTQQASNAVALVTGANRGIGFHIARQLALAGLTVLVGSRDPDRGGGAVEQLVGECLGARVRRGFGRLDVLVNNAGTRPGFDAPSRVTVEDLRRAYETNVFGAVATTNTFLPLLRESAGGRIVNVSSDLGSMAGLTDPEWEWAGVNALAYQFSKTAQNAATVMYAKELRDTRIKVNAVNPGFRSTDMNPMPGSRDPAEGAAVATRMALIDEDGPTGEFHTDDGGTYPW